MIERLIITKNGLPYAATVAAGTANSVTLPSQIDVLKPGSIAFFEKNGTKVTSAGSFTKTDDKGYLLLGMPDGIATRKSPLFNWNTLSYVKNVYKAAVAQVGVLGGDGVTSRSTGAFAAADVGTEFLCTVAPTGTVDFREGATALLKTVSTGVDVAADTALILGEKYLVIAAGTPDAWGGTIAATLVSTITNTLQVGTKVFGASYGVTIQDLEKETWEKRNYGIELMITDAGMTNTQMLTALAAAINAHRDASLIVTASVAGAGLGLIFTGVTAGSKFKVTADNLLYGTAYVDDGSGFSKAVVQGEGTNAQILKSELAASTIEGKTGTVQKDELGEIWKVPSLVESGLNYTTYVLSWWDQRDKAYPSNNANPNLKTLEIAVPSGDSTMITALDNILADLIA